jgi:hypothetical protein
MGNCYQPLKVDGIRSISTMNISGFFMSRGIVWQLFDLAGQEVP